MPRPNAELKARLLAEAEAAIEKLLAERVTPGEASLADIERVALTAGLPAVPIAPSDGDCDRPGGRKRPGIAALAQLPAVPAETDE